MGKKEIIEKNNNSINKYDKEQESIIIGRPKKTVDFINKHLEEAGYPAIKKKDVTKAYLQILNLDENGLQILLDYKSKLPYLYRIILDGLQKGKNFDILEKMLDRSLGKAKDTVEIQKTISNEDKELIKKLLDNNVK